MRRETDEPVPRLRDRTRAAARDSVRAEIAERALELFDERGFDETTVDDIAAAAGVSPRSFFRYFPVKEDVVIGDPTPFGLEVRDALAARPESESPWQALRACLGPVSDRMTGEPERSLRTMRVMTSTASLRARQLEKHLTWTRLLLPLVVRRLDPGTPGGDLAANALIASAFGCLDAAVAEWTATDGARPLGDLLDLAFAAVHS